MIQITKKEFIELITNNESIFMGVSREDLFPTYHIANCIDDYFNMLIETRKAIHEGKYIVFSGGSKLSINDDKYNKYTMYKYDFDNCIVLANCCRWFSPCDNEWCNKTMYYMIKKA